MRSFRKWLVRILLHFVELGPARLWKLFVLAVLVSTALWLVLLADSGSLAGLNRVLAAFTYSAQMVLLGGVQEQFPLHPTGYARRVVSALWVLGLVLPALASASLIKALFHEQLRPWLFRWVAHLQSNHVVIVGAGGAGMALLQHYLDGDDAGDRRSRNVGSGYNTIVMVEGQGYTDRYREMFRWCSHGRLVWIAADARHAHSLGPAVIGQPRRVYITAGNGDVSLEILDALINARGGASRDVHVRKPGRASQQVTEVLVRVADSVQRQVLDSLLTRLSVLDPSFVQRCWVRSFSMEALAARSVFLRYWPFEACRAGRADIVLIGSGPLAIELLNQISRLGHFDTHKKTRVRWLVAPGSQQHESARAGNAGLAGGAASAGIAESIHPVVELEIQQKDPKCLASVSALREALRMEPGVHAQRVFVCTEDQVVNAWLSELFHREILRLSREADPQIRTCRVVAAIGEAASGKGIAARSDSSLWRHGRVPLAGEWDFFDVQAMAVRALADDGRFDALAILVRQVFLRLHEIRTAGTDEAVFAELSRATLSHGGVVGTLGACLGLADGDDSNFGADAWIEAHKSKYWSACSDEERWSNRDVVDHMALKIAFVASRCSDESLVSGLNALVRRLQYPYAATDEHGTSLPQWTASDFDALMDGLGLLLQDNTRTGSAGALQRIEHRRWAAFKLARGWQRGTDQSRQDLAQSRLNVFLVDYEELADDAKRMDSPFILIIPSLLRVLWEISPSWQRDG